MPFAIIQSEEISCRYDFSILANARGWKDAVEVGVDQGVFAAQFMSRFQGHWLFGIDPYEPHREFPFDRTVDMMIAARALAPYHGRVRLVRGRSEEVAPWVGKVIRPQFIYVDGSHDEGDVMSDLISWWEVLAPEGMLAGHDYDPTHPGVTAAVERFARERGLVVRLTCDKGTAPSWYCYRTEPAVLIHRFFRECESPNPYA